MPLRFRHRDAPSGQAQFCLAATQLSTTCSFAKLRPSFAVGADLWQAEERAESEVNAYKSRADINRVFKEQQSFEIWMMFVFKLITSIIFLIDDLTFLLYCEYEFHMT